MKDSGPGANGTAQSAKPNQLATISDRKLRANRENAKKSTGPKTRQGKAYSQKNALKHGLFCRHLTDFEALTEDPQEYQEMLSGLWEQYQPIGTAEEIEVERVAICCWRLKRAWRYENAVNLAARRDFVRSELTGQAEYCKQRDKEEEAIILQLQSAKKEIEDKGEVSQELKQRILALMPEFEELWSAAAEWVKGADVSKTFRKLSTQRRSWVLGMYSVTNAIAELEQVSQRRWTNVVETAIGQHAIPNREALDKILRYEAAIDRSLSRAVDRLEHLQRCRRGEAVLPPVRVRLTR
jgi:hypothetical protein